MWETLQQLKAYLLGDQFPQRLAAKIIESREANEKDASTAMLAALNDVFDLPDGVLELYQEILAGEVLPPCTAADLAVATGAAFVGVDPNVPEQLEVGMTKLLAIVACDLEPPWSRGNRLNSASHRAGVPLVRRSEHWNDEPDDFFHHHDGVCEDLEDEPDDPQRRGASDHFFWTERLMEIPLPRDRFWLGGEHAHSDWHETELASEARRREAENFYGDPIRAPWKTPIWRTPWGASLYLLPDDHCEVFRGQLFWARLDGAFTDGALQNAIESLDPYVGLILDVILDAATTRERVLSKWQDEESGCQHMARLVEAVERQKAGKPLGLEDEEWIDYPGARMRATPSCAYVLNTDTLEWFCRCLDICLMSEEQREGLAERIHTSLMLIGEARRSPHDAMAVALSFAAIEALLTEKNDRLVDVLRDYCVILLQPDPAKRTKKQRSRIETLYNRRSELMHGRGLGCAPEERAATLRLAAGVLRAVCAYEGHCAKLGQVLTKKELRRELFNCSDLEQGLVGGKDLSDLLPQPTK